MNPFEFPPSTPPAGFDPPAPRRAPRRRGVMAAVALTSAGLVAGGVAVVSQLASADEPSTVPAAAPQPGDETVATNRDTAGDDTTGDDTTGDDTTADDTAADDTTSSDDESGDADPVIDGQITIDIGNGEPITIDLGEIGDCIDLPIFEPGEHAPGGWSPFPGPGEHAPGGWSPFPGPVGLPDLGGGHVIVTGPDGVSVADFGEGDGSVTITKSGDAITVESDGDVTVHEPGRVIHELPEFSIPELPDLAELQECLDDAG